MLTLDSGGDVGMYPAVTIGTDSNLLFSYQDTTNGTLSERAAPLHLLVESWAV